MKGNHHNAGKNKPKGILTVDVLIIKTPRIVSARDKYPKGEKTFGPNTGCPLNVLSLIQVKSFFSRITNKPME